MAASPAQTVADAAPASSSILAAYASLGPAWLYAWTGLASSSPSSHMGGNTITIIMAALAVFGLVLAGLPLLLWATARNTPPAQPQPPPAGAVALPALLPAVLAPARRPQTGPAAVATDVMMLVCAEGYTSDVVGATHCCPNLHFDSEVLTHEAKAVYGRTRLFTTLMVACATGNLARLRRLIAAGANVNATDGQGRTPLYWAAANGHVHLVPVLLATGADPLAQDTDGKTALYAACKSNHPGVVAMLVTVPVLNSTLDAPSHAIVRVAVAAVRDTINGHSYAGGQTHLHLVAGWGFVEVAKALVGAGANVNATDGQGRTPFDDACSNSHMALAVMLKQRRADINARDTDGNTAMHRAAAVGKADVVDALFTMGAKVGLSNNQGMAPIHAACAGGHLETVVFLVRQAGVEVTAREPFTLVMGMRMGFGRTPAGVAQASGQPLLALLLDVYEKVHKQAQAGDHTATAAFSKVVAILTRPGARGKTAYVLLGEIRAEAALPANIARLLA